jgi:hypothetical protein
MLEEVREECVAREEVSGLVFEVQSALYKAASRFMAVALQRNGYCVNVFR